LDNLKQSQEGQKNIQEALESEGEDMESEQNHHMVLYQAPQYNNPDYTAF